MESIPVMFRAATRTIDCGIEGYYVENKYFDARRSKEQKAGVDKSATLGARGHTKRTNYLDDLIKAVGKMPGPTTYNPHDPNENSPKIAKLKVQSPPRRTIFDEMQTYEKKRNVPAAGIYDHVDVEPKGKVKGNLSKAEVATYLDNSMRGSIQCPGVGQYNTKGEERDHRGPKWVQQKERKKSHSLQQMKMKFPPVGTYNPLPVQYSLFDNSISLKKSKSKFSKSPRFPSPRLPPAPSYSVISEWGMKDRLRSKDILSRLSPSSSTAHHSVYY